RTGYRACTGVRIGIRLGAGSRAGFRACACFQFGIATCRSGIGARRCDAGPGHACPHVRRIGARIGIGTVEHIARPCRRQSRRIVRTVRRERTSRKLTGRPYRRARPHLAQRDDTPPSPSFLTGISAPRAASALRNGHAPPMSRFAGIGSYSAIT
uniref:hypothetical protein n=1 Tax=Burkholderia sp. LMG 13014 TaxID=2709306 RepID=UPI00164018A1